MSWLTWSAIGTGIYLLAKKPASADLVPKGTLPVVTPKKPSNVPVTVTKTVITQGRKYLVTRAGLGIYQVTLASNPTVFQILGQNGPLQEGGDPQLLAQLKLDEQQFPKGLFAS